MTDAYLTSNALNADEVTKALKIAAELIDAGISVFAAAPNPDRPGQYYLPKEWEKITPSTAQLARWRPGWALAAIGGHAADFLDIDPRSGGRESEKELRLQGQFPRSFGQQCTPSGGDHHILSATGERKSTGFMPGLDLQSGGPADQHGKHGRGFVYISPTVRPSKAPETLGQLRPYRWVEAPDMELLREFSGGGDDSTEGIVARVWAKRSTQSVPDSATVSPDLDNPFMTTTQAQRVDRVFTLKQAQDYCRPILISLQEAKIGEIEERCNAAAAVLSHFVPAIWNADQAMSYLRTSLAETAYDPNGPSHWTVEKFRPVLDGGRPVADGWKAVLREQPEQFSTPVMPAVPVASAEQTRSTLERLRALTVSGQQLAEMEPPVPLVYGLLNMDTESWLIGAPGSFKSFVALDVAAHVGKGLEWQGHRVRQGGVLYVAAEGATGMTLRTRAWIKEHGDMPDVHFVPSLVRVISDDGQWPALVELAREIEPVLIVIDTQARVTVGLEENSAKEMGIFTAAVGDLRRATGACVLVVHHTGRDGKDARGSSAIDGAQDTELKLVRLNPRSALKVLLKTDKQKDRAEEYDGLPLMMRHVDLGVNVQTGERMDSLVCVAGDAYDHESGKGPEDEDAGQAVRIREPEDWTREVVHHKATVQRQILQVLRDACGETGRTEPQIKKMVADRWYGGQIGRGTGKLLTATWDKSWVAVEAATWGAEREPAMIRASASKYALHPAYAQTLPPMSEMT